MSCNCRKNRQVYTGPPAPPANPDAAAAALVRSTAGGQPPITPDAVVADGQPSPSQR